LDTIDIPKKIKELMNTFLEYIHDEYVSCITRSYNVDNKTLRGY